VAYVAEAPPPAKTPEWGAAPAGPDGKKADGAAPKGWRGQGEWAEDWGELNTGEWPGL
jgi:acylaminoacyl-peptidase